MEDKVDHNHLSTILSYCNLKSNCNCKITIREIDSKGYGVGFDGNCQVPRLRTPHHIDAAPDICKLGGRTD